MKRLRTYYERELTSLHGFSREYAEQCPAQAERSRPSILQWKIFLAQFHDYWDVEPEWR
jgi:hypothetical protein